MKEIFLLKKTIAASLYIQPCTFEELMERDFVKNKSRTGIDRLLMYLEKDGAVYYKGDVIYTNKKWAKAYLREFELDFRSKREKEQVGWSEFKKDIVKKYKL